MKTEILITALLRVVIEQRRDATTLQIVRQDRERPDDAMVLNPEQLDDVIQALELCRDSYKRRNRK